MPDIKVDPPSPDELEISLFGPGRGECVVVHLGNNDWLVVDSCLDNTSSQPVALWIEFENIRMLLGGDLEQVNDPDMGWNAVLEGPNPIQGSKASVFKVPHHGSHNGHNDLKYLKRSTLTMLFGNCFPE